MEKMANFMAKALSKSTTTPPNCGNSSTKANSSTATNTDTGLKFSTRIDTKAHSKTDADTELGV